MTEQSRRRALRDCRRVVVKVGSRVLAELPETFERLAADLGRIGANGRRVVLVSSGAIALGMHELGMSRRPRAMASLQAAAAVGQRKLVQRWAEALSAHGLGVAQVLLTHADLSSRIRANNARSSLDKLLELGVVPIVNENDAVAVEEIRFGDNDELAAMVTPLCDGDLLVLLSDVEGVLDEDGSRVGFAERPDDLAPLVRPGSSGLGRGGMESKLEAARRATLAGAQVVIASARRTGTVSDVLDGGDIGTLLPAQTDRLSGRKHWIAYTLRPCGAALLDDGAARAVREHGKSVMCVGVIGVRGRFDTGDMISVLGRDGREIARGLSRLSAHDAARLCGVRDDPPPLLIHRDDLVVLPS